MANAAEAIGRETRAVTSDRTVAGEEQIRHALLDAAIASILERGFYRASSNEIARRADVTWGAIQYHFGTREELLLAVLERSFDRFVLSLAATELTGATVRDRLAALARVIWAHYGDRLRGGHADPPQPESRPKRRRRPKMPCSA